VDPSLPPVFALGLAYGDLLAAALALAAILALRARWPPALALVWLFSVAGTEADPRGARRSRTGRSSTYVPPGRSA
jgi:hypothetical protein